MLVVIIYDRADEPERLDPLIHAEIVQDVERSGMDGGGARLLMDDVALVEQRHGNAGAAEHEAHDEPYGSAAGNDDPVVWRHRSRIPDHS